MALLIEEVEVYGFHGADTHWYNNKQVLSGTGSSSCGPGPQSGSLGYAEDRLSTDTLSLPPFLEFTVPLPVSHLS